MRARSEAVATATAAGKAGKNCEAVAGAAGETVEEAGNFREGTLPQNRSVLDASRLMGLTMKCVGRLSEFNSVIDRRLLIKLIEQPNLRSLFTRNRI
jgi:hypothetical protein